jgi:malyl-CoA/(S)-citramalyl-CoA lyase
MALSTLSKQFSKRVNALTGRRLNVCGRKLFATFTEATGPLAGVRVVDLSRILAGPSATQMLADMGAEVLKVEQPKSGDDTRRYAPPFLQKGHSRDGGEDSDVAAYFSSCNRNKYSIAVDFKKKEGQDVVKRMLEDADVLIENFKPGGLAKYGLSFDDLKEKYPHLVYCSISGFGHSGPYSKRPAYDMLIQAMGGSMSLTGEVDGAPMKTGLSLFDLTSGLHGVIGILAALHNKQKTGLGQHVDIAMLDVAVSLLCNQGMNFLARKTRQKRVGNNHPNVVPYQVMPASDGYWILTASNNEQFERFLKVAGRLDLMEDDRFNTMEARVVNRDVVTPALNEITLSKNKNFWLEELEKEVVGCAPILHLDEVFADPQVQSRDMEIRMNFPGFEKPTSLIGSPMKFSRTQVDYRMPPPRVGEHTEQVLQHIGFTDVQIDELHEMRAIDNAKFEVPSPPRPLAEKKLRPTKIHVKGNTWKRLRSLSVPSHMQFYEDDDLEEADFDELHEEEKTTPGRPAKALKGASFAGRRQFSTTPTGRSYSTFSKHDSSFAPRSGGAFRTSFTQATPAPERLDRSELYVPGTQDKIIPKAAKSKADMVIMDLEDSVAIGEKETARKNVVKALNEVDWGTKTVGVRINSCDSAFQYKDIVDIIEQAGERCDIFIIPMVGVASDIYAVDMIVSQVEKAVGRKKALGFGMIIETPLGMSNVHEIAAASKRNESLHFGVADYAASTRSRTTNIGGPNPNYGVLTDKDGDKPREFFWGDNWHYAMARIVVAARGQGLRPVDGPFGDIQDPDGYKAQCNRAAVLGCEGKWAIHPSQVALANEVFSPSEAEVTKARRIFEAMEQAQRDGLGAVSLDVKLIDIASIKQAEQIIKKFEATQ